MRIIAKSIERGGKLVGKIKLLDAIGDYGASARDVRAQLDRLRGEGASDLLVSLDSPGGDAFAGLAIHDAIRGWSGGKRIVSICGLAASSASVIAMAGDEIELTPHSMVMIHEPKAVVGGLFGAMLDVRALRKVEAKLEVCRSTMADVYAKRTGKPVEEIEKLMEEEKWYSAKDAVAAGFATRVVEEEDDEGDEDEDLESADRIRMVAKVAWEHAPEAARALLERARKPAPRASTSSSQAVIACDVRDYQIR